MRLWIDKENETLPKDEWKDAYIFFNQERIQHNFFKYNKDLVLDGLYVYSRNL